MKNCSGFKKDYVTEMFNKDKYISCGLSSRCKVCIAAGRKERSESRKLYDTQWRSNNRTAYNNLLSEWRRANPTTDRALKAKSNRVVA